MKITLKIEDEFFFLHAEAMALIQELKEKREVDESIRMLSRDRYSTSLKSENNRLCHIQASYFDGVNGEEAEYVGAITKDGVYSGDALELLLEDYVKIVFHNSKVSKEFDEVKDTPHTFYKNVYTNGHDYFLYRKDLEINNPNQKEIQYYINIFCDNLIKI